MIRPRAAASEELLVYEDISKVEHKPGWLWDTARIYRKDASSPVLLRGIFRREAALIEAAGIGVSLSKERSLSGLLRRIMRNELFTSAFDDARIKARHEAARADARLLEERIRAGAVSEEAWRAGLRALDFEEMFEKYSSRSREEWNALFVPAEIQRIGPWVKQKFASPLTEEQLRAVVNDEDNQLVVAGAGTGKTTTVMGKVAYLVECRKVAPERILVLAFNTDAATEVRKRVEQFGIPVSDKLESTAVIVSTYHALGGNIIQQVGKTVRKKVARLDEDKTARDGFIQQQLLALLRSKETHADVRDFLAFYSTPIVDARDFPSYEAYVQSDAAANLRTLRDGLLVKSHGERLVANWLHLHGIDYEYEKQFAFPGGNPQYRRYLPDFTVRLPGTTVYIEYYGVDAEGRTAPGIDRVGYLKSREWKRRLHAQHGTKCIELTYAQLKAGALFPALSKELEALLGGPVEYAPVEDIEKHFIAKEGTKPSSEMESTAELLNRFLTLYRSNIWTVSDIESRMTGPREACFFRIFKAFLSAYMKTLESAGETDFAGMIADAVPLCAGLAQRFDHIVVDEFQDISRGREMFLRALLELTPGRRLCAVGDDWQSIYRFTGSDVSVMTGFKYGVVARTDLRRSFRFDEKLLRVSSEFIQKNPAQLKKQLVANRQSEKPSIFLLEYDDSIDSPAYSQAHAAAVEDYVERFAPKSPEVMFLSRYRNGVAKVKELLPDLQKKATCKNLTVHRSKGLEADCVILSNMRGGRIGFPCAREDDSLIKCVLTDPDEYLHAEERRLFYVALTRARSVVYILAPRYARSMFVSELLDDFASSPEEQLVGILGEDGAGDAFPCNPCPVCRGQLVPRTVGREERSVFWSCENSPACYYTAEQCAECQNGPLLPPRNGFGFMRCATCRKSGLPLCPRCRLTSIVKQVRRADHKPFWACSFFPKTGCTYSSDEVFRLSGERPG